MNADTIEVLTATPVALTDKNLYAYCDNNPVMRADHGGEFWLTCIAIGLAAGVVAQYVGDVIGNVKAGKSGKDIFKPTSSITDYAAAGVSGAIAAIPGGGLIGSMAAGAAGNVAGDLIRGNISSVGDLGVSAFKGAAANGIGYGIGKAVLKIKVNKINNMSRSVKKTYLRDTFYKNSQKNVNVNLRTFNSNPIDQVTNRFWVYRAGVYATVTSTSIGRCLG